jgi:DNA repair photolyase
MFPVNTAKPVPGPVANMRRQARRRPAVPSSASLFPPDPEHSPNAQAPGMDAPTAGLFINGAPPNSQAAAPVASQLVGIARLAASSPPAETRRHSAERPEYFLLPVKSILNRCDSDRVPFEWTINPYRGCEFGCKYCYARYTHEYMEIDGNEFERKIYVKQAGGSLLSQEIGAKIKYKHGPDGSESIPEHIAIGTATDPYQPAEREYGVTRACLEELAKREGLSISITTKSNQIVRDIDVLKRIAERSALSLNITVTTLRPRLARLLEPRAPRPDLRLAAVKLLRESGLAVGVSAAPLLPGITDRDGELEGLATAAKGAGAMWFWSNVVFLMPSSMKTFMPFLREKFPRLARQYEEWYTKTGYAPEDYRRQISERVAKVKRELGFTGKPWEELRPKPAGTQLSLGLAPSPARAA